jgi:hypothetical protein
MKVFMSWSGARSKAVAELLHSWVKCVVQASQPWISTRGIDRGALWYSEINNELKDTTFGIICLTQENKNAPWILFEAGALAKGLASTRVCTFLVDLNTSDIRDPLAQFNHTLPSKEGLWNLVATLNSSLDANRLELHILERVFETNWPYFETEFAKIKEIIPEVTVVTPREEKDLLSEILEVTRGLDKRMRMLEVTNDETYGKSARNMVLSTRTQHLKMRDAGILAQPEVFMKLQQLASDGASMAELSEFVRSKGIVATSVEEILGSTLRNYVSHVQPAE